MHPSLRDFRRNHVFQANFEHNVQRVIRKLERSHSALITDEENVSFVDARRCARLDRTGYSHRLIYIKISGKKVFFSFFPPSLHRPMMKFDYPSLSHALESEKEQEGHHETKEPHGLGKGESENGVGEQLLLERRVPGVTDDERTEDGADTGTGSGNAHSSGAGADVLGGRIDVHGAGRRLEGPDSTEGGRHPRIAGEQGRSGCRGSRHRHLWASSLSGSGSRRRSSMAGQCRPGDGGNKVLSVSEHDCFLSCS